MSIGYVPQYFRPYKSILRLSTRIPPPESITLLNSRHCIDQEYSEGLERDSFQGIVPHAAQW